LKDVASLERYSKHPLADAVIQAANEAGLPMREVRHISEKPGEGLAGQVDGKMVLITSRKKLAARPGRDAELPPEAGGLECVIVINNKYAATMRFRDEPRLEGRSFIQHLTKKHHFNRLMLVSGDRESEVRYLANRVGISEVHFSQTPEQKVQLVREATKRNQTLFMGDGINDAPALTAATVGIAFGQQSDVTAEAAGVVILDSSLEKTDEFLHISRRMRAIALQSAVGGMALSIMGMGFAAVGLLPPVAGAICQEIIDVFAVVNALRAALPPKSLTDYD
jgi:cation transport ATPase